MTTSRSPTLSVIVTIVDGGDVLRRFLRALTSQDDPPRLEILVPWDASVPEIAAMAPEFPDCEFIAIGNTRTIRPITTAAGQHELYDRRRAAGLARATGEIIGILEDRAPPRAGWARTVVRLHQGPWGAIGGAIECAPGDLLNWAFYVCDFSRYGLPFASGPRRWISDVNVSYKRALMDTTRDVWHTRFNETLVHWRLLEQGETLYLSSELVVDYQSPYRSLLGVLPERFHWGRLFGSVRTANLGEARRWLFVLLGPLIPVVLVLRHARTQAAKGNLPRYFAALPLVAILTAAWTAGEVWGYLTRRP
jgi:hypothetical protein